MKKAMLRCAFVCCAVEKAWLSNVLGLLVEPCRGGSVRGRQGAPPAREYGRLRAACPGKVQLEVLMANFTFETMTSTDAANFTTGDVLTFSSSTLTPADVVVANSGNAFDITTLTAGGKSLSFPGSALSGANIQFVSSFIAGSGATLAVGTNGSDEAGVDTDSDGSYVYGFGGDDDLVSDGSGASTISGGDGNDDIFLGGGGSVDGGAGNDVITLGGSSTDEDSVVVTGGAGNDSITLAGNAAATVTGGAGVDSVTVTGDGLLNISLGDGNDTLTSTGADGAMIVEGGAGSDTLNGGTSNDRLYGQSAAGGDDLNDLINGNGGSDYIQGNAGADTLNGGDGSDRIFGGADNDAITGGIGNDTVNGNKGADNISGDDGNDSLRGGADNDTILGGIGNDVILGDAGDDSITGGAGADILTGGAGNDVFVFRTTDANRLIDGDDTFTDRITDFATGDKIDLGYEVTEVSAAPGLIFTTVTAAFNYAADADITNGEVLALTVGTDTYLFYDAAGTGGAASSVIALTGVTTLTDASFVEPA
ncbi:calcium-binding protein [Rhizorhabdus sp. FW153]|uniref:calcium-binding protein n=1 Tax=Rhizorhabdus sp. FW153 TaxID=3400216 RepID=UPI003CF075BE